MKKINLRSVQIGTYLFKTPLFLASGTWGLGDNLLDFFKKEELQEYFGAFVTKGISLFPMEGNPPPRLAEVPCGLINSIGLENPGIKEFKRKYLPKLLALGVPVIVNLHGEEKEEFLELAKELLDTEVMGIELNISCPNVKKGGLTLSENPLGVKELLKELRKIWNKFLSVKLSPVSHVFEIAGICEELEVDAIVVANTYPAMKVLSLKPLKILKGGLSGPAIKALTLRLVYELREKRKVPIIASGGIMNGRDFLEYLLCGAVACEIGTANLIDPRASLKILKEAKEIGENYGLCN